jgi:GTP 3',8-cyclase
MKNEGKISYRFKTPIIPGKILYVNLIGGYSCTNNCIFCGRPRRKEDIGKINIYEEKANTSLYLKRSPSVEKVISEIDKNVKEDDEEVAIVGLGEPLIYFDKVIRIIKSIKERHNLWIRIDTNGLVRCHVKNAARMLKTAGLDEIRISVNAISSREYNKLCAPAYRNAFSNIIRFVKECMKEGIDTKVSFVTNFKNNGIKTLSKEEYAKFAYSFGIKKEDIIFREYIPVNDGDQKVSD